MELRKSIVTQTETRIGVKLRKRIGRKIASKGVKYWSREEESRVDGTSIIKRVRVKK